MYYKFVLACILHTNISLSISLCSSYLDIVRRLISKKSLNGKNLNSPIWCWKCDNKIHLYILRNRRRYAVAPKRFIFTIHNLYGSKATKLRQQKPHGQCLTDIAGLVCCLRFSPMGVNIFSKCDMENAKQMEINMENAFL